MTHRIKLLFILLFHLIVFFAEAQTNPDNDPAISVKLIKEPDTLLTYLPILLVIASLGGIFWQIQSRRRDDMLKNQLDRLNKQITEFYGPLYSLYETGTDMGLHSNLRMWSSL